MATSTAEIEYMAVGIAAQECVRIKKMFSVAVGANLSPGITLLADSHGATKVARKDASGTETKHADIKYHLV